MAEENEGGTRRSVSGSATNADQGGSASGPAALSNPGWEPPYSGASSFMRRPLSRDFASADVVVCGIPCDITTSGRPGARLGPREIRASSLDLAFGEHWPWGFDPLERLRVVDGGDVVYSPGHLDSMLKETEAFARSVLAGGALLLSLGGEHLVSLPLLRAHAAVHGPLALVHFDAHSDTWSDEAHLGHGNMFYHALNEGLIDLGRSVQVGIRTHNPEDHGFEILDADWALDQGAGPVSQRIKEVVGEGPAYLTFDIDCLDPAFAPGTGTPVVGGFSTRFARQVLAGLTGIEFVGMDLVEVAPGYDHAGITSLAAATLALDFLCLISMDKPGGQK